MVNSTQAQEQISSFVQLKEGEAIQREYYIAHSSLKRFHAGVIPIILIGLVALVVPGLILILYFALRPLKVSHGHAAITNQRIIYYEFNSHPHENYRQLNSLHLDDVTGLVVRIDRTLFTNAFSMTVFTQKAGLKVGAKGFLGFLNVLGKAAQLEPGPDALEFVQEVSGLVARRQFDTLGDESSSSSS